MSDRTIVYQTFYNPIEANIVIARLQDSGIACFLADENISILQHNQAVGGVKLIIFERDKTTVDIILSEENALEVDEHPVSHENFGGDEEFTCEKCGSHNVTYGQATKSRFSLWVMLVSVILTIYPFKAKECFHCYDCGHEFQ